jgi:hypothetical protein
VHHRPTRFARGSLLTFGKDHKFPPDSSRGPFRDHRSSGVDSRESVFTRRQKPAFASTLSSCANPHLDKYPFSDSLVSRKQMNRLLALFSLATCAFAADDSLSKYQFRMTQAIVTPKTIEECAVPFTFEIDVGDGGMVRIHVTIPVPKKEKGTPESASLIVTTGALQADEERDVVWVHDATHEKNQKRVRTIGVPSAEKKITEDFFLLSRADAEKCAIRVHYRQPLYGGDEYWVLVGRFLRDANQTATDQRP